MEQGEPMSKVDSVINKIPTSFTIFGREIKVLLKDNISQDDDAIGEAKYRVDEIWIQNNTPGYQIPKDKQVQTFYHELLHYIITESKMFTFESEAAEEKAVDVASKLLYQTLKTMKYKE